MAFLRRNRDRRAFPTKYGVPFPSSVTSSDIIAWMDGRLQMYSDSGGTTPQNTYLGTVYRINEASPLTSNWAASSASQVARKDPLGLRFDFTGTTTPAVQLNRAVAPGTNLNNCTMLVTFIARDGVGGPQMGLGAAGTPNLGIYGGGGGLGAYYNGGNWQTALSVPRAQKCTAVVRWFSNKVDAALLTSGAITTDSLTATVTGGTNTNVFQLGNAFAGAQGFYGSINQFLVINRAVSDTERAQLLYWGDTQNTTVGYPTTSPLIGITGDSIARVGVGAATTDGWCWNALKNIRSTKGGDVEMCNVAITGSGVVGTYAAISPYYSAARAKNIVVFASGSTDLANNNGPSYTLTNLYAQCDLARAQGWKVVICTIIDRSGLFGGGTTQTSFNNDRATVNTDIRANWASHADALADVGGTAGVGNVGDSTNLTNFAADGVHPLAAGHAIMEPVNRAAILSLM